MDETHRLVATRIRQLAKAKKMPLTHLSDRAGVGRSQMWNVLSGRKSPTLAWLLKVAAALDVDPIELLRRESPPVRRTSKMTAQGQT